jgi:hypothetical protein
MRIAKNEEVAARKRGKCAKGGHAKVRTTPQKSALLDEVPIREGRQSWSTTVYDDSRQPQPD